MKNYMLPTFMLFANLAAAAVEIAPLPNPSFEEGDYGPEKAPKGWTWRMQGKAIGRWEAKGRTGRCISLENPGHEDQAIADSGKFPIEPGQNYRLSFWHRARDPIVRHAEVWINFGEKNANAGCRNFTVTTTRDWQQRIVEFTTPNIRETFIWFVLYRGSENSKWYVDDVKLEKLGPAKVTPETISWKMESTSVQKSIGGLFTRIDGPKTSRPLTTVVPLTALSVVNTAPPRTPVIDGTISDVEYAPWASTIGPLRELGDGRATKDKTYAYVTCDDKKLYIAWKATYRGDAPKAAARPEQRDGPTWNDDCVEVLFQPPGRPLIHFIGNAAGTIYDDRDGTIEWNGNWQYQTSIHPGVWHGELAIAWTDLGLSGAPPDGSEWRFDICRTSPSYSEQCKWCWLTGVPGFTNREFMGRLRFDAAGWSFHLRPLGSRLGPNSGMLYVPMSRRRSGSLIWGLAVLDQAGKEVLRKTDILTPRKGDLSQWGFQYDLPEKATYTFSMSVQDPATGNEVFQLTVPLDARPDLQVDLKVLPFQKRVLVEADSSRTGLADDPGNSLRARISKDGQPIGEATIPRVAPDRFKGEFSIEDLAPATYELQTALVSGAGRDLATTAQELLIPPVPKWLGNELGKTDRVLPPFTPVEADGTKVSVWNRTYEFGPNGLPSQIRTAGEAILVEPASVRLVSGGKPLSVNVGQARLVSASATTAVVESTAAGKQPRFSTRVTTEYDGMMRIDFELDPGPTPIDVDRFTIRFAFQQKHALYVDAPVVAPPFHHVIDRDGWRMDRSITGEASRVYGRFWLGDDDRGIDFTFLSDQGWRPYDRPDAIQIVRRGRRVDVDLNILGKVRLNKPVNGTLLVTATPVRPFPKDHRLTNMIRWDGRPMKVVKGVDTYGSDGLKTFADFGADVLMLSDHWSFGYGRPEPFDPPNFARLAGRAKDLGMKIIVYVGVSGWAERGPEAPYLAEWEQIPTGRSANGGRPDQQIIAVSLTRDNGGHDCLIYMLDRMIREYDIDGVYVDGLGWTTNKNMRLGFGYVDETGKVRPTSTILEIRELFRRITGLFASHGKQAILDHHCSWMLAAPVDVFSTGHLTGEYLAYRANEHTALPEDYFRIENTGRQWGIPVEVLVYNDKLMGRYIANTYIYGCSPATTLSSFLTGPNVNSIRPMSPIWKAFGAFDVANAEWVPYWKAGQLVRSESPDHKLSFYRHPTDGLLLLLANTSREPGTARIRFDLKGLGFGDGRPRLQLANKKAHSFEFKDGVLTTQLAGDDLVMFRMTP